MAINRVSPGIEIREFDRSIVARGPRAPSGALAGVFRSGPINTPVLIGNKNQLIETFGEPSADNMETFYTFLESKILFSKDVFPTGKTSN